jgi:hypothetical protein
LNHPTEIFIANLASPTLITFDDSPIHNLLLLDITQIAPNHQLQNVEQIAIRDKTIFIFIIDFKREPNLVLGISIGTLTGQPLNKLHKRDFPIRILIKNFDNPFDQRIFPLILQPEKFLRLQKPRIVYILLAKSFEQFSQVSFRKNSVLALTRRAII